MDGSINGVKNLVNNNISPEAELAKKKRESSLLNSKGIT